MWKTRSIIKIFLLLLPSLYFVYKGIYDNYSDRLSIQYVIEIFINIAPVTTFFILDATLVNRQNRWFLSFVQSSFYVYVYFLVNYTILYIPFSHFLFQSPIYDFKQMQLNFNLVPFHTIFVESTTMLHLVGNFVLLLPLGIYIPLLYNMKRMSNIIKLIFLVALGIEIIQLLFSSIDSIYNEFPYRKAFDIDDLLLNTLGGLIGVELYKFLVSPLHSILNTKFKAFNKSLT
jgi:glycopeptide antibiotics resistance protein